jgi:hypothetical protein
MGRVKVKRILDEFRGGIHYLFHMPSTQKENWLSKFMWGGDKDLGVWKRGRDTSTL